MFSVMRAALFEQGFLVRYADTYFVQFVHRSISFDYRRNRDLIFEICLPRFYLILMKLVATTFITLTI